MATVAHSILAPAGRRTPFAAQVMTPSLRAAIQHEAAQLLDAATFLLDFLNAADAPAEDMEPSLGWHDSATSGAGMVRPYAQTDLSVGISHNDLEGDGCTEASLQPVTLAPPVRPVQVIRPSRRQMRAAYRANGDAIPAELRGLIGRAFA